MTEVAERQSERTGARTMIDSSSTRPAVRRSRRREALWALGFLSPQLVGLIVFMVGPLIFALFLSLTNWDGFGERTFAGLANYGYVFSDPQLAISARNTIWLTVMQVPGLLLSGFIAAFFLQKAGRLTGVYRVMFFAPQVTSSVAVAAIWLWLFNPEISPINNALAAIGIQGPDWLQDPRTVIIAFALVGIWHGLGYQVVMFMAGLSNVPKALMEAADIDGANGWQKLRKVTLPMLSPTILFLSITSIIASFQIFDIVYVMLDTTAPSGSRTIVYEIVQVAFRQFAYGKAAAIAVCLFIMLLLLTGLQLLAQRRWVYYAE